MIVRALNTSRAFDRSLGFIARTRIGRHDKDMRLLLLTRLSFIEDRMILLLFPSVAALAACLILAAFMIFGNESTGFPILADFLARIIEDIRLSSKILPIVSIYALCLIMLLVERAPLCLEIEHIEVSILRHIVNHPRL